MTEVKRPRRRATPSGIAPTEPERDILDQYLYEVSTYPLLKGMEEIELGKQKIKSRIAVVCCFPEPGKDDGGGVKYRLHLLHLFPALLQIFLVDTQCIDPYNSSSICPSDML